MQYRKFNTKGVGRRREQTGLLQVMQQRCKDGVQAWVGANTFLAIAGVAVAAVALLAMGAFAVHKLVLAPAAAKVWAV